MSKQFNKIFWLIYLRKKQVLKQYVINTDISYYMIGDIREHSNDKMYQMRLQCLPEHVLTLKNE